MLGTFCQVRPEPQFCKILFYSILSFIGLTPNSCPYRPCYSQISRTNFFQTTIFLSISFNILLKCKENAASLYQTKGEGEEGYLFVYEENQGQFNLKCSINWNNLNQTGNEKNSKKWKFKRNYNRIFFLTWPRYLSLEGQ